MNGLICMIEWQKTVSYTHLDVYKRQLYRSSILYENEKYYIFYSGYDINDNVGIGIMYGEDMKRLRAFCNVGQQSALAQRDDNA